MMRTFGVAVVALFAGVMVASAQDAVEGTPKVDISKMHVCAIKDGKATVCGCDAKCDKCGEVKEGKCGCGKDTKEVDLKGKFVCEKCKVVSGKADKCGCGADLAEVK